MFVNCKKNLDIREKDRKLLIPQGYIGEIPEWAASHWLVKAAIKDGVIVTPENKSDTALEKADQEAAEDPDQKYSEEELPKNKRKQ